MPVRGFLRLSRVVAGHGLESLSQAESCTARQGRMRTAVLAVRAYGDPLKVIIPDTVLSTELQNEGVLLNLESGEYFGLDEVGMSMWKILGAVGDVEEARARLLAEYDVTEDVLTRDLDAFIATLAERKLIHVTDE